MAPVESNVSPRFVPPVYKTPEPVCATEEVVPAKTLGLRTFWVAGFLFPRRISSA